MEERAHGGRSFGLGREEEEAEEARRGLEMMERRSRGGRSDTIVLVDHVIEVLIGGEGDEGVEVVVGELVLEGEGWAAVEEGAGETGVEVGEGGTAVEVDDAGVAADVAEGAVVGTGDDVAAVAAHEPELVFPIGGGRWNKSRWRRRRRIHVCMYVALVLVYVCVVV